MRVLHCSDIHANDRWFRWLIGESRHFDLVCLSGDILDLNAYRSTEGQLERVMVHLQAIEAPLAICSGNPAALSSGISTEIRISGILTLSELSSIGSF